MMVIVWGPVSEWFAGTASFFAVAIALYFSTQASRNERDAKFRSLYAWSEHLATADSWKLVIRNSTSFPIYQWSAQLRWQGDENEERQTDQVDSDQLGIIPPGENRYVWTTEKPIAGSDARVHVSLVFRDATGAVYYRSSDGQLRKGTITETRRLNDPIN
jgi:hypothetical protein